MSSSTGSESSQSRLIPADPKAISKLIVKLRWIGLDREAERLSARLAQTAPEQCRMIGPHDTD
jgi:hypothetical protein